MTDIVERLRTAQAEAWFEAEDLLIDAIAELERLRAELDARKAANTHNVNDAYKLGHYDALEEAAKVAETMVERYGEHPAAQKIASDIRALKEKADD
jgi:hypothetical protein